MTDMIDSIDPNYKPPVVDNIEDFTEHKINVVNELAEVEQQALQTKNKQDIDDLESDFQETRTNIKEIINKTKQTFANLNSMALGADHPRVYEALTQLLTASIEANNNLFDLHKRKQDALILAKKREDSLNNTKQSTDQTTAVGSNTTINNSIFVGTAAEVAELIKNTRMKQNNQPVIDASIVAEIPIAEDHAESKR